ncbi:hypothetical protein AMST5_03374 [freshwater sediment metagenome]|uniref:Phasin domain-containing protein n=1 Tax=freshwater sediment metagenome TaxID=556182 RepID=A0AA48M2Y7_9ZZZZ
MADDAKDQVKNSSTGLSDAAVEYGRKVLEFGFINTVAAFEAARKLAAVKSPQEYFQTATDLTREHFERLSEQIEELSEMAPSPAQSDRNNTGTGFWD